MKTLAIALLLCFGATAVGAENRSIKVTAKSEIKVAPDEVVLRLEVHTRNPELLAAKHENDKISSAVLALVSKHSIPAADVKVTNLDVSPDYGGISVRQPTPVAYDFIRSIEARLTDFEKIEPFLADAFETGLTGVAGLQFRVSNQREHQFQARKLAVTYAREKAEHLTQLTGMKLGLPIHIEEEVEQNWNAGGFGGMAGALSRSDRPDPVEPVVRDKGQRTFVAFQQAIEKKGDARIAAGQIIITAHVTIEYEISK